MKKRRYWPVSVKWRWHERNYTRLYGIRTHACLTRDGTVGGWVLHLWAVKVVFG